MFKKLFLFKILFIDLLFADASVALVEKLERSSPLILSQKALIIAKKQDQFIYTNYKNPKISVGVNDITLDKNKITKRDIEPMQTQYLSLSQEIQNSDKIDTKNKIALLEIYKEELVLQNLEFDLLKQLRQMNLQISYNQNILKLLDEKLDNLKKLQNYYTDINGVKTINLITKIKENIYQIKDKKNEINLKIHELKNNYSYILLEEYKYFEDDIEDASIKSFNTTPLYKMLDADVKIKEQSIYLSRLEKTPDVTLSVAYNYRENYDDYLNVGVGFALPIYGTEEKKIIKNQSLFQKSKYTLQDYLTKSNMRYENFADTIFYLKQRVQDLDTLLSSYEIKIGYLIKDIDNKNSIAEVIKDKNTKLDLLIKKMQLKSKIESLYLEQIYLTKESLL
jgi:hypothetical protein